MIGDLKTQLQETKIKEEILNKELSEKKHVKYWRIK
jgi:hypothetical protein